MFAIDNIIHERHIYFMFNFNINIISKISVINFKLIKRFIKLFISDIKKQIIKQKA